MGDDIYRIRATKGDPVYQVIEFTDQYGNPFDLTGLTFSMTFKYAYGDQAALFAIDMVEGIGLVDDDATGGQLYINILDDQSNLVAVDCTPKPGIAVPYTQIVGDLKIGFGDRDPVVPPSGSRVKIFLTVEAATS